MWVQSLGQGDPLEEKTATHSSILAWKIPWTEETGGLQAGTSRKGLDKTEQQSMSTVHGKSNFKKLKNHFAGMSDFYFLPCIFYLYFSIVT